MENVENKVYEWDDVIQNDGQQWVTLPKGDYNFTVLGFERARHPGSAKLPPCNKAVLDIRIDSPGGSSTIKYNLFLYSAQEWKLCQFFTAIGQRKRGEPLHMNWGAVNNAVGRCKVDIRKWTNDKGEERESNEILEFYEPADTAGAPVESRKFTPGAF